MLSVDMVYFITHYCCSYLEIFTFISISKYGMYEIHLLILIVSNKKCIYYYTRKLVSGYFKKSLFFFIQLQASIFLLPKQLGGRGKELSKTWGQPGLLNMFQGRHLEWRVQPCSIIIIEKIQKDKKRKKERK